MTDLEERLSRELNELSERAQPGSIRPLREPAARKRRPAVRWLPPFAAVAAVLAVIAGVSVIGQPGGRVPPPPGVQGPMPRYYVTVWQTYAGSDNGHATPTFAAVHDSATGAALATVRVPTLTDSQGGTQGPSITAAGDDRTFVITEQSNTPNITRFYLLRVAANGRSAKLRRLPVSVSGSLSLSDVALSPDGTRLAMDVQDCNARTCLYTAIRVVTIATGAVSTWNTRANGAPFNVSWVGNERVAFQWQPGARTPPPGQQYGYRLLSLAGAGRDLLAARPIGSPRAEPSQYMPAALVTPDGNTVVTSTVQNVPEGHGRDTVVAKIIELSARTGRLLRVLHTVTMRGVSSDPTGAGQLDQDCNVLSLAPRGIHVLVACYAFGRVDGGRFTPLRGFPSPSSSGISGQQAAAW